MKMLSAWLLWNSRLDWTPKQVCHSLEPNESNGIAIRFILALNEIFPERHSVSEILIIILK